jgi:hypothetical protein
MNGVLCGFAPLRDDFFVLSFWFRVTFRFPSWPECPMARFITMCQIVSFCLAATLAGAAELRPVRGTVNVPCRLYIEGGRQVLLR